MLAWDTLNLLCLLLPCVKNVQTLVNRHPHTTKASLMTSIREIFHCIVRDMLRKHAVSTEATVEANVNFIDYMYNLHMYASASFDFH